MKKYIFTGKGITLTSFSVFLFAFLFSITSYASIESSQTVRGTIRDKETHETLIGANVLVIGSDPLVGATTDINGKFSIQNVPLGRIDLKITLIGYNESIIPGIMVTAGKQVVLEIELEESLTKLNEVVIDGGDRKTEGMNEMAVISSHTFSVEETKRFAGGLGDPARMVSAFAGVTGDAQGRNDIVVRGNSSKGILWKLEGVEIPNPNHFGSEGSTGGPINALNSTMLSNSDFYTGAFAPEYGNASSGVFDMKLRSGNNEKSERSISIGAIGMDATLESPFSKKSPASYLVNYRYSSLAILDQLKLVNFYGVPKYQDGSFKVQIPTAKAGTFSVFGLGGLSTINQKDKDADNPDKVYGDMLYKGNLGVAGINHVITINEKAYLRNSISASTNGNGEELKLLEDESLQLRSEERLQRTAYRVSSTYNHKITSAHTLKTGLIYSQNHFRFFNNTYDYDLKKMVRLLDEKGNADMLQGFASWKFRITEDLTLISGIHYTHFLLNNSSSVEPRAAVKWQFNERQSFNAGYGIHSKLEPLTVYFAKTKLDDGSDFQLNKELELAKANHFVLGYQNLLTENLILKTEIYYQSLFDVPVENSPSSSFSLINSTGWFTTRQLVNEGQGRNYGLELTLEKYFSKRWFLLATGSLYQSEYKTLENKWRNTLFNGNYAGNLLFGKEFSIGKEEMNRTIGISGRITYAGGNRYTPILLEKSIESGYGVRDEINPYSAQADDLFMANVVLYYRKDYKKVSHEFRIDIQNVTNHSAMVSDYYNARTKQIEYGRQLAMIPMFYYKIDF